MLMYLAKRLVVALCVCIAVSLLSFGLMFLVGDPAIAIAGSGGSAQDAEAIRIAYGFDRPFLVQYLDWIARVLQGNLGQSIYFNIPVTEIIGARLPVTMKLGIFSFLLALAVAVPLGIAAALKPNGLTDRLALLLAVTGQAIPSFWLGLMAIVVFGVWYGLVPISGANTWRGYILPVIVLAYSAMPAMMRITRSSMIDVMGADYIRTAYAKGLSGWHVIAGHAVRNARKSMLRPMAKSPSSTPSSTPKLRAEMVFNCPASSRIHAQPACQPRSCKIVSNSECIVPERIGCDMAIPCAKTGSSRSFQSCGTGSSRGTRHTQPTADQAKSV